VPPVTADLTATSTIVVSASVSGAPVDGQADIEGEGFIVASGLITIPVSTGFSSYLAEKLLGLTLLGSTYTPVTTVYLALCTSPIGTEIPAANGYSRQVVSFGNPTPEGTATKVTNDNAVSFGIATDAWPDVTHVAYCDAPEDGNRLYFGEMESAILDVLEGDTLMFASDALSIRLD